MPANAVTDRIGSYRVIKHLSVTGSVSVHLAREDGPSGFPRNVVLKMVPRVTGEGAQDIEELTREVTACAKLTHPGIVRIRHFFVHDDALVLVLEHVDGITLAALLANQAKEGKRLVTDDAACQIGVCICDALAHAHALDEEAGARAPIVHRAVNPSNVLIARDGAVKLDGFGFANLLGGVATDPTGGGYGWTPAYMAPEQVTIQPATPKIDVYAAGLILWELFAGRPPAPFPHNPYAIEETLRAVANRKPPSLATVRPDLPADLIRAVDGALVSAPEQRTIGCADLARWLRQVGRLEAGKRELRELVIRSQAAATAPSYRMRTAQLGTLQGVAPPAPKPGTLPKPTAVAAPTLHESDESWLPPEPVPERNVPRLTDMLSTPPPPAMGTELHVDSSPYEPTVMQQRPSLVNRLRAPTPWRRAPMIVAWGALTVSLVGAVTFVAFSRGKKEPPKAAQVSPPPTPEPVSEATPTPAIAEQEPTPDPSATAAPSAEPPAEEFSESLKQRHLGYLIVHSSAPHATVYVNLKARGKIDEKLTVPCGNRFVSIGVPTHTGEPSWLAPGKSFVVPCGGPLEITMDPHALRGP